MKKFISTLNVHSMLRHGSVAVITMFTVWLFFGSKNLMLAFPIALTSTVLSRQNMKVKPIYKYLEVLALDITIVLVAYISSLNIYTGIFINFAAVFIIIYTVVSPYDLTFYKPFIMLYIFSQYAAVSASEMVFRILSIITGIFIIYVISIIRASNEKNMLGKSLIKTFKCIDQQLDNIINNDFDYGIQEKCSLIMSGLAYRIYISRHRGYLTTNIGRVQFNILLSLEYMNLILLQFKDLRWTDIIFYKNTLKLITDYDHGHISEVGFKLGLAENEEKFHREGDRYNLYDNVKNLTDNIQDLERMEIKDINKVYMEWKRSDIDKPLLVFREYFNKDSIRFKFAMRMAIAMTIALFAGEYLGYYKVIWAIITMMSILKPYYEETVDKARERVIGNIIAIVITGSIINLADNVYLTVAILVISLYLLYGFKEYYKISLFAAMASICLASLTQNINVLIYYRLFYLLVGVAMVFIVNRYVFPYHLKDGVLQLIDKILRLNCRLMNTIVKSQGSEESDSEVRDIILHSMLLTEKLYQRNLQYNDEGISRFIIINRKFVINIGYKSLVSSKGIDMDFNRYTEEEYRKFLKSVSYL